MKMNKYKNLFVCVGIIAFFLIIMGFIYKKYREGEEDIVTKIEELDKRIPLGKELEEIEETYRRVNSYLLENFLSFKGIIEIAAGENNITIKSLEVSSRRDTDVLIEIEVEVVLSASYEQFTKFLQILERVPSIKVKDLSIQGEEGLDESLQIRIKFVGLIRKPN